MQKQSDNGKPLPDGEQKCARATLSRILESPAFRASKQCQSFLLYVFERSLSGQDEPLKERDIGVKVFGRDPAYNTGDDPIVRVRATEVRKRLTQYYADSAGGDDIRIDIPPGRYRVEFHRDAPKEAPVSGPVRRKGFWFLKRPFWLAAIAVVMLVSTVAGVTLLYNRREAPTVLDRFWSPFLSNPKAVVIYCGRPVAYFLSSDVYEKYGRSVPPEDQALPLWSVLALPPNAVIRGRDIIPVTDKFVGIGSAHAAILLHGLFVERHKQVDVRYADDLSFSDLRTSPTILIGAFSNLWTLKMMRDLQFVFEQGPGYARIRDTAGGGTWERSHVTRDGSAREDYAIISRLILDPATGQPLVSIAGIGADGTKSAAEFATNFSLLHEALANAQPNWPNRNLQVLLHTDVYSGLPGRPKVVALHIW